MTKKPTSINETFSDSANSDIIGAIIEQRMDNLKDVVALAERDADTGFIHATPSIEWQISLKEATQSLDSRFQAIFQFKGFTAGNDDNDPFKDGPL